LKKIIVSLVVISLNLVFANSLIDDLSNSRASLAKLIKQQESQQREYNQLEAKQLGFQQKVKISQTEYDNLSKEYRKFSDPEMAGVVDDNKLSEMRKNIPNKKNEVNSNTDSLNYYKSATEQIKIQIDNTKKNIAFTQEQVTNYQADLFDEEILKEVWSEGYAEEFLTTDRTEKECNRLVRESALRDATDKAGKSYLESFSKVKNYVLVEDNIVTQTKTRVIEEDVNSSYVVNGLTYNYGKVNKVLSGETFKFFSRVRIKVQGISDKNPFRKTADVRVISTKSTTNDVDNSDDYENPPKVKSQDKQWNIKNDYYGSNYKKSEQEQSNSDYLKQPLNADIKKQKVSYSEAVAFSMIVPGIGQQATGRKGAAQFYFWFTVGAASYYCWDVLQYNTRKVEYDDAMTEFETLITYDSKIKKANEINSIRDDLKSRKKTGDIILYTTAGLYLLNVLDVLIFTDSDNRSYSLSPKVNDEQIGLTLSWSR